MLLWIEHSRVHGHARMTHWYRLHHMRMRIVRWILISRVCHHLHWLTMMKRGLTLVHGHWRPWWHIVCIWRITWCCPLGCVTVIFFLTWVELLIHFASLLTVTSYERNLLAFTPWSMTRHSIPLTTLTRLSPWFIRSCPAWLFRRPKVIWSLACHNINNSNSNF